YAYLNVFLLACFNSCNFDDAILLRFLKILDKYLFAVEFFTAELIDESEIKTLDFSDTIIKLSSGNMVIKGVIEKLEKLYNFMITSEELRQRSISYYHHNGFYHISWLRYFLCEYEFDLMKKSKCNIIKLDRCIYYEKGYNSIEHILPENSHYQYWLKLYKEFNSKQREKCKNSLGNFVAISKEKNSKLGNLPFPEKKSNNQNTVGYKYGTYAEIELTQYDDWNAYDILNRGVKLITFLNERWGIKIGSKKDKKYFLGLDFLD
ncbi:MAG TPA: HNH endonuclease family protein, partial [Ruminiclostridium sp.]|nr:HNH endonuclease family protein [Ruminiclostridium sp.]